MLLRTFQDMRSFSISCRYLYTSITCLGPRTVSQRRIRRREKLHSHKFWRCKSFDDAIVEMISQCALDSFLSTFFVTLCDFAVAQLRYLYVQVHRVRWAFVWYSILSRSTSCGTHVLQTHNGRTPSAPSRCLPKTVQSAETSMPRAMIIHWRTNQNRIRWQVDSKMQSTSRSFLWEFTTQERFDFQLPILRIPTTIFLSVSVVSLTHLWCLQSLEKRWKTTDIYLSTQQFCSVLNTAFLGENSQCSCRLSVAQHFAKNATLQDPKAWCWWLYKLEQVSSINTSSNHRVL